MTRRDFVLIANAIKEVREYQKDSDGKGSKEIKLGAIDAVINSLTDALATTNPAFDRVRFMEACK